MDDPVATYLLRRIRTAAYRGVHLSQHNRITQDYIASILRAIYDLENRGEELFIPPGDDQFPGQGPPGAEHRADFPTSFHPYLDLVERVNRDVGKGTFNSIKKNTLPDFEGMRLVRRESREDGLIELKLTTRGSQFLSVTGRERTVLLGESVVDFVQSKEPGFLEELDVVLEALDYISLDELMLFASDRTVGATDRISLIRSFRAKRGLRRARLMKRLISYCDETMTRSKVDKRDWGNWRNSATQNLQLLGAIPGYKLVASDPTYLAQQTGLQGPDFSVTRSERVKREAREAHQLDNTQIRALELHHVVPLSYAQAEADLALLDDFRNIIPLIPERHGDIPNVGNVYIQADWHDDWFRLVDPLDSTSFIEFEIDVDVFPHQGLRDQLLDYNKVLVARFS